MTGDDSSSDKKYRDRDWLEEKYHTEGLTQREIANLCDVSRPTIQSWMDRLGVKTNRKDTVEERFWSKVDRSGPSACWEWEAGSMSGGYGCFHDADNKPILAHRFAFRLDKGTEATGYVLHRCGNKSCVNPNHLYESDQSDNSDS